MEINYTRKSVAECLEQAWHTLISNTRTLVKQLWLPAVLMGIVAAITYPFTSSTQTTAPDVTTSCIIAALVIINIACSAFFLASFYKTLNNKPLGKNLSRVLKFYCMMLPIAVIITAIIIGIPAAGLAMLIKNGLHGTISIVVATLVIFFFIILAILLMLPFEYLRAKFMIEGETKIRQLPKFYKQTMHHIPMLFGVTILAGLVMLTLSIIFTLPNYIIITANQISMLGVANGDPSGMPSNISYIIMAVMLFSTLITCVLQTWYQLVIVQAYTSIESRYRHDEEENQVADESI